MAPRVVEPRRLRSVVLALVVAVVVLVVLVVVLTVVVDVGVLVVVVVLLSTPSSSESSLPSSVPSSSESASCTWCRPRSRPRRRLRPRRRRVVGDAGLVGVVLVLVVDAVVVGVLVAVLNAVAVGVARRLTSVDWVAGRGPRPRRRRRRCRCPRRRLGAVAELAEVAEAVVVGVGSGVGPVGVQVVRGLPAVRHAVAVGVERSRRRRSGWRAGRRRPGRQALRCCGRRVLRMKVMGAVSSRSGEGAAICLLSQFMSSGVTGPLP